VGVVERYARAGGVGAALVLGSTVAFGRGRPLGAAAREKAYWSDPSDPIGLSARSLVALATVSGAVFGVAAASVDRRTTAQQGVGGAVFGLCFWGAFQLVGRDVIAGSGRFPIRERLRVALTFAALGAISSRAAGDDGTRH